MSSLAGMWYLYRLISVILVLLNAVHGWYSDQNDKNATQAIDLMESLLNRSDYRVRPNIYGPPVAVDCDIYVQGLGPIDEVNMEFYMDIYFRQRWTDKRMTFKGQEEPVFISPADMKRLWVPDIFFPNEKQADMGKVTVPNKIIKIFPDGLIRYSARLHLRLACSMILHHFPLDYQDCSLKISSYSYDELNLKLSWLKDKPIELNEKKVTMPQFDLLDKNTYICNETLSTGKFSCLEAVFHFKRLVGFYVLQTYVPSILIVSISWVSFWISKDAVPARITLGVTTVLTMTTQLSTSRSNLMRVSYPKAIDVWYSLCMFFVYSALLEYAIVNLLSRHEERISPKDPDESGSEQKLNPATTSVPGGNEESPQNPQNSEAAVPSKTQPTQNLMQTSKRHHIRQYSTIHLKGLTAKGIDKASRIIFPLSFVLFNVIYWIVYTQQIVFSYFYQI